MTVYVDDLQTYNFGPGNWRNGQWCHLWTDGEPEELHQFGSAIGLVRSWAQISKTAFLGEFLHYDLRPSKRALALRHGAEYMPLTDYFRADYQSKKNVTTVKALSLWDPWATAMRLNLKKVETRGWSTDYRGPLVIHAAKTKEHVWQAERGPLSKHFDGTGYGIDVPWPFGCAVCVVDVIDCRQTQELASSLCQREIDLGDYRQFGDDGKQRYGIITANLRVFETPIPCRGAQGFWNYAGALPKGVEV